MQEIKYVSNGVRIKDYCQLRNLAQNAKTI
jgi:hypothetical protein